MLAMALPASANRIGAYLLRGIVRDSVTNEVIPFASVATATEGTLSDNRGIFELSVPDTTRSLVVTSQGYARKIFTVRKNNYNLYEIRLAPQAVTLNEVVVHKSKYSKKNNPAVDLANKIRKSADITDPLQKPYYNYNKYQRITLGINNFDATRGYMAKHIKGIAENVDTSEISGKPFLPVSVREITSDVHYRRQPQRTRELITGLQMSGLDDFADAESMRAFLTDVLREVDLYDRDINLLQNRFVSPLSPIGPDFYKYYITDTVRTETDTLLALSFYPHNKAIFGFVGRMLVQPTDSSVVIRQVNMRVASEINLNFIRTLTLNQTYDTAPDGTRLKTGDDLIIEASILPGTPEVYIRRNVAYSGHNFSPPADGDSIFSTLAQQAVVSGATTRDSVFWESHRLVAIKHGERNVDKLMVKLRKNVVFRYGEKAVRLFANGYVPTANPSKFDIGPLNTFVGASTLQGFRLRTGGMTTAALSPRWFSRFYVARGFRDHKWNYGFELEYSFHDKEHHSRQFPVHSLRLNSIYDVDQLGQHYLFTNPDNIFLALKRTSNDMVTYHRYNALTYTLELQNHFSVTALLANDCQFTSRLLDFVVGDRPLAHFNETYGEVQLRYAPGEKFYQTRSYRFPINQDAPVITITHRVGPGGQSWSRWHVNRTEVSAMKRLWFSAWGFLDILGAGGHVWSTGTPYTQLFAPNANLSYTIQPESFALLNPMEFVGDSYASWFVTYWANGAILNYVPLLKKLKLREAFSLNGYWSTLSDGNNPAGKGYILQFPHPKGTTFTSPRATGTPYIEGAVGVDNLFKCLRVDYVWRLTHRYPGYTVDRSGLRIALHVTF